MVCQNASFIIYLIFLSHRTIYIFIKQLTSGVAGQFLLTIQLCVVMLNVRMDTITLSNNEFLQHYYLCVCVGGWGGAFPYTFSWHTNKEKSSLSQHVWCLFNVISPSVKRCQSRNIIVKGWIRWPVSLKYNNDIFKIFIQNYLHFFFSETPDLINLDCVICMNYELWNIIWKWDSWLYMFTMRGA